MAEAKRLQGDVAVDPFMMQFDRGVALLGYGLLLGSPFLLGLPAIASLALAIAHRLDPHPVTRTHYRFQSRIFWTTVLFLVVGIGLMLAGGGVELTAVAGFLQAHVFGASLPSWLVSAYANQGEQDTGNLMMVAGVILAISAVVWLVSASIWGVFKLVLGRPIGPTR